MKLFDTISEAIESEVLFWRGELGEGVEVTIEIHRYGNKYSGVSLPESDEVAEIGTVIT